MCLDKNGIQGLLWCAVVIFGSITRSLTSIELYWQRRAKRRKVVIVLFLFGIFQTVVSGVDDRVLRMEEATDVSPVESNVYLSYRDSTTHGLSVHASAEEASQSVQTTNKR